MVGPENWSPEHQAGPVRQLDRKRIKTLLTRFEPDDFQQNRSCRSLLPLARRENFSHSINWDALGCVPSIPCINWGETLNDCYSSSKDSAAQLLLVPIASCRCKNSFCHCFLTLRVVLFNCAASSPSMPARFTITPS
ncbi:hypothetical protein PIB30_007369 [Stylosanthes scabra]|uniref:Uncharacterized protein n=1 Tax=Stylosanthes scabra TaxID=79078 RepID=A0ABU6Z298_9FABA|nr:hypothetical protein [Stylosanthes scabra]